MGWEKSGDGAVNSTKVSVCIEKRRGFYWHIKNLAGGFYFNKSRSAGH